MYRDDEEYETHGWLIAVLLVLSAGMTMLFFSGCSPEQEAWTPADNTVSLWLDEGMTRNAGSGFVYDDYIILTARHIVTWDEVGDYIYIREHDGDTYRICRLNFRAAPDNDIAAIKSPYIQTDHPLTIKATNIQVGDKITVLGYPGDGTTMVVSEGVAQSESMRGMRFDGVWVDVFGSDADLHPGDSGAMMIDPETNELIGVATGLGTLVDNITGEEFEVSFGTPTWILRNFVELVQ